MTNPAHYSSALPVTSSPGAGLQAKNQGLVGLRYGRTPTPDHGAGRICEGCGCRLSRYNPDELCSACMPEGAWILGGGPSRIFVRANGPLPVLDPDAVPDIGWCRKIGKMRSMRRERDDEIVRLYRRGMTISEVGHLFGLTGERVRQVLAANGVPRRSVGWRRERVA